MIHCNSTWDAWGLLLTGISIGWVGVQLTMAVLIVRRYKRERRNGHS